MIADPSMNWLWVQTDAMVVSSLIVTLDGGLLPSTVSSAIAAFSPLSLLAFGSPPTARMYRLVSLWAPVLLTRKRPSPSVLVCASCLGAPALASHKVTVDWATGAPAPSTCPVMLAAPYAGPPSKRPEIANAMEVPYIAEFTLRWSIGILLRSGMAIAIHA